MPCYSVYGVPFATSLSLRFPLPASSQPPRLHLSEQRGTRPLATARLLSQTPDEHVDGGSPRAVYRAPGEDILLFPDGDQAVVRDDAIVYLHAGDEPTRADYVEVRLIGGTFAWWLLRQGRLPFHAGALMIDGEAVLFMAESGTGKSSLMCSLIGKGFPLLCDDFVTVQPAPDGTIRVASAYPQMRLWPETIEHFIGSAEPFPPVTNGGRKRRVPVGNGWGHFLEGVFPVTRIYLLQRQAEPHGGAVALQRAAGHEGFMSLLAAILLGPSFPLGELETVWTVLQQMTEQLPIYKLTYPTGWQWLPDLHRAVLTPQYP